MLRFARPFLRAATLPRSMAAPVRCMSMDVFAPATHSILPVQASFGMTIPSVPVTSVVPTVMECPEMEDIMGPILAIKRTYQPSVLRRKRKFGFRVRKASLGGRKVLNNRFLKGRKRLSL
ncbi:hypothetical protein ACHHYP_08107 [Achlya hypogyna]|uniref:Large ribosomal subunit protein bL34m n=1 Tax=Achlya hypogyna TaxID=1202772 RepID=A0A1V9YPP2_ACHHY|nr:hypothetical protein ACHHYP_08107 [Achlya hypogyna]